MERTVPGPFKRIVGMAGAELVATVGCRLMACVLVLSVIVFVLHATTPFPIADAWFYVDALIRPWQEGHLTTADFFVRRGSSDHMQPLFRLILLMHTAWFHMDFTVQALIGVAFAVACVYLWYRLSRNQLAKAPQVVIMAQVIGLGMVAAVFSLNARGVYDWPLVTLAFMGILAVSVLLAATPALMEQRRWVVLALLVLLVFVVDDTFGIMAAICDGALLALMRLRGQVGVGSWLRACGVLAGVGVAYLAICHALFPYQGAALPQVGLDPLMTLLKGHWRESFKLIVIPAGTTLVTPDRIDQTLHSSASQTLLILVALSIPVCLAHVWFWVNYLRRKPNALMFVAAGLMLFFYLSLAAILVFRLPKFGFDYLYGGRYMQVYELQLVALLMMSAQVLSDRPVALLHKGIVTVAVLAFTLLTCWYAVLASREVPYIRAYQVRVAQHIGQLASDPQSPPEGCNVNLVTPCGTDWTPERRISVLQTLERGPYNVFSPTFRRWHRHQVPKAWSGP